MMDEWAYTEYLYLECYCGNDNHLAKFQRDREYNELTLSVQLNQYRGFWKRVWVAIKYVLKIEPKYGHWDCLSIREVDVERLIQFLRQHQRQVWRMTMENEGIYGEDAVRKAREVLNEEFASLMESAATDVNNNNGVTISGPGIELTCYTNDDNYPEGEDPEYLRQMEEAYAWADSVYKAYDYLIQNEIDQKRIETLVTLKASWSEDNK